MRITDFILLNEVHYTDVFPKNFSDFITKYKAMPKSALKGLYVNFSLKNGVLEEPSANGPSGTYAFPIQYVLDHPTDVWRATKAKFIRILNDVSKNKINLGRLHGEDVETILTDIGLDDADKIVKFVHKNFKTDIDGGNKLGKVLMCALNTEISDLDDLESSWNLRDSDDQQDMLLAGGYDAIEDKSSTPQRAAIDKDTPEQIVFLTRRAFRIIESISLKTSVSNDVTAPYIDLSSAAHPLAMSIAQGMNESLYGDFREHEGWVIVGTTNGLTIGIKFLKLHTNGGVKTHREFSDSYPFEIVVKVDGENLDLESHYPSGTRFERIARDVAKAWNDGLQEPSEDMIDDELIKESSKDDLKSKMSALLDRIRNLKANRGDRKHALKLKQKIEEMLGSDDL